MVLFAPPQRIRLNKHRRNFCKQRTYALDEHDETDGPLQTLETPRGKQKERDWSASLHHLLTRFWFSLTDWAESLSSSSLTSHIWSDLALCSCRIRHTHMKCGKQEGVGCFENVLNRVNAQQQFHNLTFMVFLCLHLSALVFSTSCAVHVPLTFTHTRCSFTLYLHLGCVRPSCCRDCQTHETKL